jgi:hypothetical protein
LIRGKSGRSFASKEKAMFSFSRIFLIAAMISFLAPCICPAMTAGCENGLSLSAVDCRQNETAPCGGHVCCKYTNHVVSKVRESALSGPLLAVTTSSEALPVGKVDGLLVSRLKIRPYHHPEFSEVLRL